MTAQGTVSLVMIVAWLIMYVLLLAACIMIYRGVRGKGASAELWLLATLIPGVIGLSLMLAPFIVPQAPGAWVCMVLGVLLTVVGPIIYLLAGEREGGGAE
ncbi:hypothetical protein DRO33_03200 [Candidatus Bathyarchaeota archaeon]|nr:MAG: hypothetical protein DRO33_03200 [Candidatus Bathyarchaeota archaeon]